MRTLLLLLSMLPAGILQDPGRATRGGGTRAAATGGIAAAAAYPRTQKAPVAYIVGGRNVDPPGKWPWQGSLQYLGRHKCGAVLIAPYYVLTAAHCVHNAAINLMWVTFGLHDKDTQYEGDPQSYKIARITIHEEYKALKNGRFDNDIAVIQLTSDRPADVRSDYIKTIAMATPNATYQSAPCVITGWGRTKGKEAGPNILQEAPTSVLSLSECADDYNLNITDDSFCAIYKNSTGSCLGDSGGPLVCYVGRGDNDTYTGNEAILDAGAMMYYDHNNQADSMANGRWQLAGISSWEDIHCDTSRPSIYVSIPYYRPWVRKVTGV